MNHLNFHSLLLLAVIISACDSEKDIIVWNKTFGESRQIRILDIESDFNGNFICTGKIAEKMYMAKCSSDGQMIWDKTLNESSLGSAGDAIIAYDEGYIAIGGFDTISIIKLNPQGEIIWSKRYGSGFGNRIIKSIDNSHYLFSGVSTTFDEYIVGKLNQNGEPLWIKHVVNPERGIPIGICELQDSRILLVSGQTISLLSEDGNLIQNKFFSNFALYASSLIADSNLICGGFDYNQNSPIIFKSNFKGDSLWSRIMKNSHIVFTAFVEKGDGSYWGLGYKSASNLEVTSYLFDISETGNVNDVCRISDFFAFCFAKLNDKEFILSGARVQGNSIDQRTYDFQIVKIRL